MRQRLQLKQQLAQLIGAQPDNIALISNTTRGVTDVALCLPWQAGDYVAVFRGDQRHSYANPGSKTAIGYSVVVLARVE